MVKLLNQYFPGKLFVLLLTENGLILFVLWTVVSLHLASVTLPLVSYPIFFTKAVIVTLICQICFYYADIYDLKSMSSKLEVFIRLLQAVGVAALILAGLLFFFPDLRLGAGVLEYFLVGIILLILFWRIVVEAINRVYGGGQRILLVGSGPSVHSLGRELRSRTDLPMTVLGIVTEEERPHEDDVLGFKCLGNLKQLVGIIEESHPDRVVIALRERRNQLPISALLKFRLRGLPIQEASELYENITGKIPVESIRPSALIFTDGFSQSATLRFYERIFGLVGAGVALLLAGPLMLLVAIAIKLDSRGPVFYRQQRVGKNGELFDIYKFRSMRQDAESSSGPVWAQADDPRISRVGRFLRMARLDELPQFINVLLGHMSFVGPRPERPFFVDLLSEQIPFYDLRHSVRPGITGWAQVSHHYGASISEAREKLEYDLFYIKNVSPPLDLLIMFQTIKIVIFGRGAR